MEVKMENEDDAAFKISIEALNYVIFNGILTNYGE